MDEKAPLVLEFKKIPKHRSVGITMMVKNEKKRLHVSLESIKNVADALIIYDTGSTDETIVHHILYYLFFLVSKLSKCIDHNTRDYVTEQ